MIPKQANRNSSVRMKTESQLQKRISIAVNTAIITTIAGLSDVHPAAADISGLTPCSESKAFAKQKKQELKALQKRLSKYEAGSAPSIALKATMDRTEKRFEFYGKSGLLCGSDGLPHLIAEPGFALKYGHAGDVFIPTFGFLYFAGWLGHSGRLYLEATRNREKEIIIDVPLASACLAKAFGWTAMVIGELKNGNLLEKDSNITVSPR